MSEPPKPPRKRGPRPQGRTRRVMIYLTDAEYARLEAEALRQRTTLSEAVRRALEQAYPK
jgi:hypothetical protein